MPNWNEIDQRLSAIGRDRHWLADNTPYTSDTIRNALAPNSKRRSDRMLEVLSRAIEDEESKQHQSREVSPGVFEIFQTEEQLDLADRASRIVGAGSTVEFCRDTIIAESRRILQRRHDQTGLYDRPNPVESMLNEESPDLDESGKDAAPTTSPSSDDESESGAA